MWTHVIVDDTDVSSEKPQGCEGPARGFLVRSREVKVQALKTLRVMISTHISICRGYST